ncbi:hypothetical protein TcWFU_004098 [Taenia crassiceps]|uniref:Uncharacterized protein n=1 Tax=Taenia crassiceps TaxID=6207 RepID=A0ABR4QDJ2_9CEST
MERELYGHCIVELPSGVFRSAFCTSAPGIQHRGRRVGHCDCAIMYACVCALPLPLVGIRIELRFWRSLPTQITPARVGTWTRGLQC